jgi:hypothetical protein
MTMSAEEEFVHEANATWPEKAAWEVAIRRGLNISRNDIRAMLTAAGLLRDTPRPLGWHKGTHHWIEHDGYPRHGHSANGVLTIDPRDPAPHFAFGPPFAVRDESCPTPTP